MDVLVTEKTYVLAQNKGWNIKICRCGGFPDCCCIHEIPTQSLLQKWLREVHNIDVFVVPNIDIEKVKVYTCHIKHNNQYIKDLEFNDFIWQKHKENYEQALEEGIFKSLNIIK